MAQDLLPTVLTETCPACKGSGELPIRFVPRRGDNDAHWDTERCATCDGAGVVAARCEGHLWLPAVDVVEGSFACLECSRELRAAIALRAFGYSSCFVCDSTRGLVTCPECSALESDPVTYCAGCLAGQHLHQHDTLVRRAA
jgi:hypothetical protein